MAFNEKKTKQLLLELAKLGYDLDYALKVLDLEYSVVSNYTHSKTISLLDKYKELQIMTMIAVDKKLYEMAFSAKGDKQSLLEIRKNSNERRLGLEEKEHRSKKRVKTDKTTKDLDI